MDYINRRLDIYVRSRNSIDGRIAARLVLVVAAANESWFVRLRARRGRRGGHGWVLPAAAPRLGCAPHAVVMRRALFPGRTAFPALVSPRTIMPHVYVLGMKLRLHM